MAFWDGQIDPNPYFTHVTPRELAPIYDSQN